MDARSNATFASPAASANYIEALQTDNGLLVQALNGLNGWTAALTLLLVLVAYDQCEYSQKGNLSLAFEE